VTGDVPRHWHEEYQFCAITGGYGELRHGGRTWCNPAGTLNLVAPGEVHSNRTPYGRGCDFLKLDVDAALMARVAAEVKPAGGQLTFAAPMVEDADTFRRFVGLYRTLAESGGRLERECALLEFLVTLLGRHTRTRAVPPPAGVETRGVRAAREYLEANYASKVELARLAEVAGLSPFHLTRVFARDTGLPPHAFLNQVRIARAKALLRSRVPIARVAAETGFADQSHLTRVFRQVVRLSPGAYRE
jgi:AraC-like DNA-binding protein